MSDQIAAPVRPALAWIDRHAAVLFAAMALVGYIGLLYLGRHGSFFQDEWSFISVPGLGTLRDWFTPHNEHWSTVPFGLYRALLLTIGLQSYLPYLGLLLLMHVAASAALFVLLRRSSGSIVALLGAGLFLVLGSAYQNLFWAFQIGFVGSTAAGLWALVALDQRRVRLAAVLFLIALASSTMGVPFLAAGCVELALDPRRRRSLGWLMLVVAVFGAWFLVIGHEGLASHPSSFTLANIVGLPRFIATGIAGAVGAIFGLGGSLAAMLVVAVVVAGAALLLRGRLPPRVVAAAVGLVLLYLLVGLGRAQFGDAQAIRSRYLYEAAALLLVGFGALVGRRADPVFDHADIGSAPDRGGSRGSIAIGLLVIVLVANGSVVNVKQLFGGARFFEEAAGELRASIALVSQYGDALRYEPPPLTRWSVPSPGLLARTTPMWGSPAKDSLLPSVVRAPTALERDRALWRLVGEATRPRPIEPPSSAPPAEVVADRTSAVPPVPGRPPTIAAFDGGRVVPSGDCLILRAGDEAATTGMTVVVELDDGSSVDVMTVGGGGGAVRLGRERLPDRLDEASVDYPEGSWVAVGVPHLSDGSSFTLELRFPTATETAVVCAER